MVNGRSGFVYLQCIGVEQLFEVVIYVIKSIGLFQKGRVGIGKDGQVVVFCKQGEGFEGIWENFQFVIGVYNGLDLVQFGVGVGGLQGIDQGIFCEGIEVFVLVYE